MNPHSDNYSDWSGGNLVAAADIEAQDVAQPLVLCLVVDAHGLSPGEERCWWDGRLYECAVGIADWIAGDVAVRALQNPDVQKRVHP